MSDVIQRGYVSPVWLYDRFLIPEYDYDNSLDIRIPPSSFSNESIFPMKLKYLAMAQYEAWSNVGPDLPYDPWNPPVDIGQPEPFRYHLIEIGKSGCSDQNLVPAPWNVLGTTSEFRRQKDGTWNVSVEHYLSHPYRLPRDCGLKVSVENLYPDVDYPLYRATFMAKGRDADNYPVILAAEGPRTILPGSKYLMDSSDLYNRGRRDIFIESFHYKSFNFIAQPTMEVPRCPGTVEQYGRRVGFVVNPISGEPFMPMEKSIPVGVLAPFSKDLDPSDAGPKVYTFPEGTYLYPRQRLGIRISSEISSDTSLDICLHGELEVA